MNNKFLILSNGDDLERLYVDGISFDERHKDEDYAYSNAWEKLWDEYALKWYCQKL